MFLEAQGKLGEASAHYAAVREAHPTGTLAWQRTIAVLKKTGGDVAAAKELSQYLASHSGDADGVRRERFSTLNCNHPASRAVNIANVWPAVVG